MSPLVRQAVRLYPRTSYTDRKAVNTLRRGWIRQIQYLGDKWLLAKPIPRRVAGHVGDVTVFAVTIIGSLLVILL